MKSYDPSVDIDQSVWLAIDENDRVDIVQDYVETEDHLDESNILMHSTAHCIVENQIALGEKETVDAFTRLRRQGLDRHNTIHAIASVVFGHIAEALEKEDEDKSIRYKSKLRKLTAKKWLKGKF